MGSVTVCLEVLAVVCLGGAFWSQEKEAGTTGTRLAGSSDLYWHGRHKGYDGKNGVLIILKDQIITMSLLQGLKKIPWQAGVVELVRLMTGQTEEDE